MIIQGLWNMLLENSNMLDIDIEIKINIKNPETWQILIQVL